MRSLRVGLFVVSTASDAATVCAASETVVSSRRVARSRIVSVCRTPNTKRDVGSVAADGSFALVARAWAVRARWSRVETVDEGAAPDVGERMIVRRPEDDRTEDLP